MSNIEEIFKKQMTKESICKPIEKNNRSVDNFTNVDFEKMLSNIPNNDEYQKKLDEKIKEMGGNISITEPLEKFKIDNRDPIQKFKDEYPKCKIEDMIRNDETVSVFIEHVFCPNCGEELISKSPVVYNPFTLEKMCKIECICGFKANLDYTVPHIKYINKNNQEIKVLHE